MARKRDCSILICFSVLVVKWNRNQNLGGIWSIKTCNPRQCSINIQFTHEYPSVMCFALTNQLKDRSMCPPLVQKGAQWELIVGVVVCRASCEPKLGGLRWKVSRLQEVAAWKKELEISQAHSIYYYKLPLQIVAEQCTGNANREICQKLSLYPLIFSISRQDPVVS